MDINTLVQNGESSRSPHRGSSSLDRQAQGEPMVNGITEKASPSFPLILPDWDIPQTKSLHPSHDLISLLSLTPLYNTYVRPYTVAIEDDSRAHDLDDEVVGPAQAAQGGKKGKIKKTRGLEKGYTNLLDDCIDPIPIGTSAPKSLMPLIPDFLQPTAGPPLNIWDGPIEVLGNEKWEVARLEVGSKQEGYAGGQKLGVREAEERRRRKREKNKSITQLSQIQSTSNTSSPNPNDPILSQSQNPSTPLYPVQPPQFPNRNTPGQSGYPYPHQRRKSSLSNSKPIPPGLSRSLGPGGSNGIAEGGVGGTGGGTDKSFQPSMPSHFRPGTSPAFVQGTKRPHDSNGSGINGSGGTGMTKKVKLAGTRSASPMPGAPGQGQPQGGQTSQGRPGVPKGNRARTEGM